MPNPNTKFKTSFGTDLGNILITKEYLMSVYPQIANQLITPELWTWGRNSYGNLGDNTVTSRVTPVTTTAGGANWKQVSCGSDYTAAIKTDGTLWTWGLNAYGQLGINNTTDRSTPVTTFAGGTNWKQVSCGRLHTTAIKTDGTLWTWGLNAYGQLGINNTTSPICTPITTFAGGTNWKQVSGCFFHTAAIKTDGTLWTWGYNYNGQLGINNTTDRSTPVTTFAGGTNWKQVSGGGYHTTAIKTDGTLWTWGRNNNGQLGNNTTTTRSTPITTFAGGTNWKQVSGCFFHTAAIKTDGTLWTWGYNGNGQLGNNTTTTRSTPVTTFAGGTNWKQVFGGNEHTAAVKTDGTLWTWGYNLFGTLGVNDTTTRCTPVTTFAGGTNWKQVSGGDFHIAAIKTSDDLLGI
jgi:alpha-tubulin suppressor-like RCC1 family protein